MPDETDNKSDIKKQSEISQSKTPTPKTQPKEELKQEAKPSAIEEQAANKPAEEVSKPVVEEEKPKRSWGKAAEPAADGTKPALKKVPMKIDESVVDRKSLLKPPNRDAKPKPKPIEEPKEEPIKVKVSPPPKDGDSTQLKVPEPKIFETTKDIVMEEASVIPIPVPNPERRPSLRNKYDPMKFIPSDDDEAGIVESNVETIADAKDDAEVNTKHTLRNSHKQNQIRITVLIERKF